MYTRLTLFYSIQGTRALDSSFAHGLDLMHNRFTWVHPDTKHIHNNQTALHKHVQRNSHCSFIYSLSSCRSNLVRLFHSWNIKEDMTCIRLVRYISSLLITLCEGHTSTPGFKLMMSLFLVFWPIGMEQVWINANEIFKILWREIFHKLFHNISFHF